MVIENKTRTTTSLSIEISFYWKTHPSKKHESNRQLENSRASHKPFYWKTHPKNAFRRKSYFTNIRASQRPFYRKTHPDQMLQIIYDFSQKIEWMGFPVKRPV